MPNINDAHYLHSDTARLRIIFLCMTQLSTKHQYDYIM